MESTHNPDSSQQKSPSTTTSELKCIEAPQTTPMVRPDQWVKGRGRFNLQVVRKIKSRSASHGTAFLSRRMIMRSGLERFAAPARLARVRIRDLEAAAAQTVHKINHGTPQIIGAKRIDHDWHSEKFAREIIRTFLIEIHSIVHAGTTPRFDINATTFA